MNKQLTSTLMSGVVIVCFAACMILGCEPESKDRQVTVAIINIRYVPEYQQYIVLLDGRKSAVVDHNGFRIRIRPGVKLSLSFTVDRHDKIVRGSDYEFIFSDYEQARKHLHVEPGRSYAKAASGEPNSCFISTAKKAK